MNAIRATLKGLNMNNELKSNKKNHERNQSNPERVEYE